MPKIRTDGSPSRPGFTIIELLVVVTIIALLIALLIPAIGKAREAALLSQSQGNLKNMATACANYGAAWNDRQWTICADDAGMYGTGCYNDYVGATGGCPASTVLGWGGYIPPNGQVGLWGYWLPCGSGSNTANWIVTWPMFLGSPACSGAGDAGFGAWRMANVKSFNDYVNGKFYDRTYYAPKDRVLLSRAEPAFEKGDEFSLLLEVPDGIVFTTYAFSPSAMWAPEVFSGRLGFQTPASMVKAAYRSPSVGQASYPELKTRMLEHQWLQNQQGGEYNGNFTGGQEPWYFNLAYNSAPCTMFFDGHIAVAGVAGAMDSDTQVRQQNIDSGSTWVEKGLWMKNVPVGPWNAYGGYYKIAAFDSQVDSSYHVFTTDGILGRDFIKEP